MKKICLSIVICVLGRSSLHSQTGCCPYIGSITTIPTNPTTVDAIQIVTTTTTPNLGHKISYNFIQQADSFFLNGCFNMGVLTQPQTFLDTISIGTLAEGIYYVKYIANLTTSQTLCLVVDSNSMTDSFQVVRETDVAKINTNYPRYYNFPNPFSSQLIFSLSDNEPTTVSLYNFLGQQVLQQTFTNSKTINTEQLATGVYFYELKNEKGVIKKGKLVKE